MKILKPIDAHVHLRGNEHPDHDFAFMALEDAAAAGLAAVIEMPNCTPNLTTIEVIKGRYAKVFPIAARLGLDYGCHVGITDDEEQAKRALLGVARNRAICGDKTYYCHSTGRMGILDHATQAGLWRLRSGVGYNGVSLGHFEDEGHYTESFDHTDPITHSIHQPKEAEIASLRRQLKFAAEAGFRGTFYVCHATCPEVIYLVEATRNLVHFKIVMEACFHHLFLNTGSYAVHGNRVKMNPPLRDVHTQEQMLGLLVEGRIDLVATDHAPHPVEAKDSDKPPSGIPSIPFWPKAIEIMRRYGMDEQVIERVTFHAANNIFDLDLEPEEIEVEYDPSRWEKYGWNPFTEADQP